MIEYLKVDENEFPVRINRRVIVQFEKKFNKGLTELANIKTDELSYLIYLGVCEGFRFLEQKNEFKTFEKFEDELDKLSVSDFYEKTGKVISDFFTEKKEK
ncbi:hypothetical protein [Echinicola shivajiensis]|uniref:hypothetical protein n=1 Tax=Echinicola shivajiensis TaxID=1035916 RepID=UPI001BFC5A15|nr:hypothetical protein [Echinicola shivajiensis]